MNRSILLAAIALSAKSIDAFTSPSSSRAFIQTSSLRNEVSLHAKLNTNDLQSTFDPLNMGDKMDVTSSDDKIASKAALASTLILLSTPTVTYAAGPDWGIFEGRTGSLLHPIVMASMFLFSLSTGYLGFQIRRQRGIGDEIKELKKSVPKYEGDSLQAAIANAEAQENVDLSLVASLKAAVPVQMQIDELAAERKEITSSGPRDKHYGQGVLLAFLGTAFAIEGPLNTYARAGKLFPGPHLYAGASLVVLWSLAAACVPSMQKGNDTARSIHIAANAAGVGLFGWQVLTGWPILLKVIEKTQWP